ncbi:MAG: J domain-containing protein [Candidatus Limnocylindrales bacterium]
MSATLSPDPYKTLQVDTEAEEEVIAAAYRRLALKYHPDTAGPEASPRMAAINAAWEILGDPVKRVMFDRERAVSASLERARSANAATSDPSATPPSPGTTASGPPANSGASPRREPETVSRDWTTGRSSVGGGYDASMHTADGDGAAGPSPGNPSGSVLNFGRYNRWSLGEIARADIEYIEWLDRTPIGRPYREEIDTILRRVGRRRSADVEHTERRGLFRRR